MTAFGYSESEVCVCLPCLPASQVLLFLTVPFFIFNFIKMGFGLSYDLSCTPISFEVVNNGTDLILPCVYGYDYLLLSGFIWLCFLPLWISTLFGNCWRQCFCCFCDPVVFMSTLLDFIKRYLCEYGKYNLCEIIWYSYCIVHLVLAVSGLIWQINCTTPLSFVVRTTVSLSLFLDFLFAGSKLFHRARLHQKRKSQDPTEECSLMDNEYV